MEKKIILLPFITFSIIFDIYGTPASHNASTSKYYDIFIYKTFTDYIYKLTDC